jgi:hypothetical protein
LVICAVLRIDLIRRRMSWVLAIYGLRIANCGVPNGWRQRTRTAIIFFEGVGMSSDPG